MKCVIIKKFIYLNKKYSNKEKIYNLSAFISKENDLYSI